MKLQGYRIRRARRSNARRERPWRSDGPRAVNAAANSLLPAIPSDSYASSTNNFVGGYDITYGDPLLRFVYARVKYLLH